MSQISGMFATDANLYVITGKAIYLVKLADDIDPARTNPNLPNLQKKVLNHGSENEIIGRVLLTAKMLLDKNHLGPNFRYNEALSRATATYCGEAEDKDRDWESWLRTNNRDQRGKSTETEMQTRLDS